MYRFSRLTVITAFLALFGSSRAVYTLQDDYSGANFFSMFSFFTDADPTHGYVDYIAQSAAQSAGLINTNNNQIYMGVDSKNIASGRGRKSVRLTSKAVYNHGLIILDLEHMPGSICGTWPAFWTVGPNWPTNGEIDIIEGVNTQAHNAMTLHTGPGCTISNTSPNTGSSSSNAQKAFSGSVATSNCDINASGQAQNAGCSIATSETASYGDGFNAAKGGVYATEWTSDVIRVWFFPRSKIPSDISSSPNPSSWGTPLASFASTSCDIDSAFKNQQIVFDTTFCGDWAGAVWSTDATCSRKAATCQEYAQNNPEAFADAFWTVNSLKVFTGDGSESTAPDTNATATASRTAASSGLPKPTGSGAVSSRPPVNSATGAKPSGSASLSGGFPVPSASAPQTTFATSMQTSAPASIPGSSAETRSWGGSGRTRTWGGGHAAFAHFVKPSNIPQDLAFFASGPEVTSVPEVNAQSQGVSLPQPVVRAEHEEHLPRDIDANMVRRHMAEHGHQHHYGGRHGSRR